MKLTKILTIGILTMSLAGIAGAQTITVATGQSGTGSAFSVSNTDLINNGQSTLSSIGLTSGTASFGSVADVNNGIVGNLSLITTDNLEPSNGAVLLVTLNTASALLGYDISSVVSLSGYGNQLISGQDYNLAVHEVGTASNVFVSLAHAVAPLAVSPNNEEQVTITGTAGLLATGVDELQFTFHNADGTSFAGAYREIDVTGVATVAPSVPEPSTFALLGFGALAFVMNMRRKGSFSA